MGIHWPKLLMKTAIWLFAEIALTCLGLDDLADYSEFVTQYRSSSPAIEMLYLSRSFS